MPARTLLTATVVLASTLLGPAWAETVLVVERATGSVQLVDQQTKRTTTTVTGLGDLSHAAAVFSADRRFGYVFGRDGGVSRLDLETGALTARTVQAGNSIGGVLSEDGSVVAVANYTPGGVKLLRSDTLEELGEIPAEWGAGARSKVVGLVAVPGKRLVFSLWDAGEIWLADVRDPRRPAIRKFADIGRQPYDGNITPDRRHYIAGLFGEDGLALLEVDRPERGVQRILGGYGKGEAPLPVCKMPHLGGWGVIGDELLLPAVGRHEVLVVDRRSWTEAGRISVHGQPVFVVARPGGREVWVNFAHPRNDVVQVIDVTSRRILRTLEPGKAIMHIEFSLDGAEAWVSARDSGRIVVYDASSFAVVGEIPARSPSGIFMASGGRALGG
jgi:protein NirF